MIELSYQLLKQRCERECGVHILEADYLGKGVLGRFFPPAVILICPAECRDDGCWKQREILVLLHEMCHYFKYLEHVGNYDKYDEEACFEFEVICDEILNNDHKGREFEAVKRLGLQTCMAFLENVINSCVTAS